MHCKCNVNVIMHIHVSLNVEKHGLLIFVKNSRSNRLPVLALTKWKKISASFKYFSSVWMFTF